MVTVVLKLETVLQYAPAAVQNCVVMLAFQGLELYFSYSFALLSVRMKVLPQRSCLLVSPSFFFIEGFKKGGIDTTLNQRFHSRADPDWRTLNV